MRLLLGLLDHLSNDFHLKVGHRPDDADLQHLVAWSHWLAVNIIECGHHRNPLVPRDAISTVNVKKTVGVVHT